MAVPAFMSEDFLLQNDTAGKLYHEYAEQMPIFDYHNHLPANEIAENRQYENLTRMWLNEDHYKWRALRANGVHEKLIKGNASDWEKFEAWAKTVPYTLRNPLYHWTHLELKRPFGITDKLLNAETAREIWDTCVEKLKQPEFSCRGIMQQWNVKVLCTTDDPIDNLEFHKKIKEDSSIDIKVLPTFRSEPASAVENPKAFMEWVLKLERAAAVYIKDKESFLEAIKKRHDFFHEMGCRLSDQSFLRPYAVNYSGREINQIFSQLRRERGLRSFEIFKFKSWIMHELALLDAEKDWTQQLHISPLRNNNTRMMKKLGPDSGFDSMGDLEITLQLGSFLDRLNTRNKLPRTIVYNLNPKDSMALAAMVGNFQDSSIPGKMQYGAAWWYLDQKDGMEQQLNILSNTGLLSRFVGMLTDSRSFLSFSRHEYFRRILCNLLGTDVEQGELPNDLELLGGMVKDICYTNAVNYFGVDVP
jgi:glucuronate isomerase